MVTLYVHGFDIEASHRFVGPGRLLSVALVMCQVDSTGRVPPRQLRQLQVNIAWPKGVVWDDATRAFWDKQPASILEASRSDPLPPGEAARAISQHLDECQTLAHDDKARYVMVTDNPAFDVAWIDWLVHQYNPGGTCVQHSRRLGYAGRHVMNVHERIEGLREAGVWRGRPRRFSRHPHDHTPMNDAWDLVEQYQAYLAFLWRTFPQAHPALRCPKPAA